MFGVLPASVLYMRHLENIDLSDISVRFREPDDRIHLVAEDVAGLRYSRVQVAGSGKLRVVEEN